MTDGYAVLRAAQQAFGRIADHTDLNGALRDAFSTAAMMAHQAAVDWSLAAQEHAPAERGLPAAPVHRQG